MKVFVSSTCYDLIDIRAELCETLRSLGATPILSDDKGSDFYVPTEPAVNSIEACLENVRRADLVIVILSQRYGPSLKGQYGEKSATHLEYDEATRHKRPMLVYVRAPLAGEFSSWKKNGKKEDFKTNWVKPEDAQRLFKMLDEHQALHRTNGAADSNNWYTTFNTSVDFRADVQKQLGAQVKAATMQRMIEAGQVPIIIPTTNSTEEVWDQYRKSGHIRFTFDVTNAGSIAAIGATGNLNFGNGTIASWPTAKVSAILPGGQTHKMMIDVERKHVEEAYEKKTQPTLQCKLVIGYITPSGQRMADVSILSIENRNNQYSFVDGPSYLGKAPEGVISFLLASPWS